jgi:hypothetical protein
MSVAHAKVTDVPEPICDVFFAYPGSSPLLTETMRESARKLGERTGLAVRTWEELRVDGRLIIGEVLRAIDGASTVVAEITDLNSNVLFEIGYALASDKHVVLCLDTSDARARNNWKEFGLLTSIGYTPYEASSETLIDEFLRSRPDLREDSLWEEILISGGVGPRKPRTMFYMPLGTRADVGKALDRILLARKDLSVATADEEEQGIAPISWYAVQIYQSSAALLHLRGPQRSRSLMHNARSSLFAGMAHALKLPTLLVAEQSFDPPLDYKDLLFRYSTAKNLAGYADAWLDELPSGLSVRPTGRRKLSAELPFRRFGEYVAENEQDQLPDYFVETGQYDRVLTSQSAVFIGRKGTGKTANMISAAESLSQDRRNLVTVIKPSGYELESLLAILEHLPARETADFLLDGLWRYMLMTEIACAAVREAEGRPAGIASGSAMDALRAYLEEFDGGHELNFAVRLERLIDELTAELMSLPERVEDSQAWLSQKLHAAALVDLRKLMGEALSSRDRVAVLIDNLDKAWERGADREQQSRMILGLLSAVGRVERDFRKETAWRESVHVTLAVFLRADIFDEVRKHAREPDKITTLQVEWEDQELLARVIEDRYVAQHRGSTPEELWLNYFCESVSGRSTRDFLLWRSLPRPRDLVYLCNACVLNAINHKNHRIEEADVIAAQEDYSRFAFDALRVEGATSDELDEVLLQFAGAPHTMPVSEAMSLIADGSASSTTDDLFSKLLRANFIGLETEEDRFEFPAAEQTEKRARVLTSKLQKKIGREPNITVHPAFRPYLGIKD